MENPRPSAKEIKIVFLTDQLNALGDHAMENGTMQTAVWKVAAFKPPEDSAAQIQSMVKTSDAGQALIKLRGYEHYQEDDGSWKVDRTELPFDDTNNISLSVQDFGPYDTTDRYHSREFNIFFSYPNYFLSINLTNHIQPGFSLEDGYSQEPYNYWKALVKSNDLKSQGSGIEQQEIDISPELIELFYQAFNNQEGNQVEIISFQKQMEGIKMVNADTGETEYFDPESQEWKLPDGGKSETPLERLPIKEGEIVHITAQYDLLPLDEGEKNPFVVDNIS